MRQEDDPLWKEILTNEILWVVVAVILILVLAFHLATR
jgi:ABC-type sugar transport system permease subunit